MRLQNKNFAQVLERIVCLNFPECTGLNRLVTQYIRTFYDLKSSYILLILKMVVDLYVVRHGQTDANLCSKNGGPEIPLNETGRNQV